ncbi:MAG TPA: VWA domain-containing protein [Thermoanaerobaculia bacterium]|nr:VWA domain-containing protein [Thermoanaerobaculia bacterium]
MRTSRRALVLLVLSAAIPGPVGLRSQQAPAATETFGERVEVDVVNVEVYVTDRKGDPVVGLQRGDFEVREDGQAVPVVNFYAVAGPAPPPAAAPAPQAAPAPPAVVPPAAVPPESQRLYLVVYVDNWNLRPFNRNKVLRQLRAFLAAKLTPEDRVMLVSYDRELHVRRTFGPTDASFERELDTVEKASGHGIQRDVERRKMLEEIHELECRDPTGALVDAYAGSLLNDAKFSVAALQSLVDSLAGIEGRKAILYVSDGIPFNPGEEAYRLYAEVCSPDSKAPLATPLSSALRQVTTTASAHRIAFYTLEATGPRELSSASAESAQPLQSADLDTFEQGNQQDVLYNLASETGGRAVLNTNQLAAPLARIADDLRTYYSLGYTPPHAGDGRVHAIKVKVRREGVKVRYRLSYRDESALERQKNRVMATLLYGLEDNPLGASLEVGDQSPGAKGTFLLPLRVKLPMGNLVFLPREGYAEAHLNILVGSRDANGKVTPVRRVAVPIRVPTAQLADAKGKVYVYEIRLQMEGGDHTVAVAIEDSGAASTSFLNRAVIVKG